MDEIVFDRVTYSVNSRRLVGPLSFSVKKGERLMLIGASGSGKTTTLRLINGLLLPSVGSVSVGNQPTTSVDRVELRRHIGYVIQEIGLLPHLSVIQNAALVPRLLRTPQEEARRRAEKMLELVGLERDLWQRHPHQLSGGQRQRVGVARALAANPPVLLCDEPFGAVDPTTRATLQREFRQLTDELGKTVVFVTHDVREALLLGDRIAVMHDGAIVFLGNTDEFAGSDMKEVKELRNT